MRRLNFGFSLVLLFVPSACSDLKAPTDDPRADTQTSPPTKGDDEPSTLSITEMPQVGESLAGGNVVQVAPSDDCTRVVVEDAAKWECSAAQIQEAKTGGVRPSGSPAAGPVQKAVASQLQVSDCKALANLRRPALKLSMKQSLATMRQQKLRDCLPMQRTLFFNKDGDQITGCPYRGLPTFDASVQFAGPTGAGGTVAGASAAPEAEGASQYSTTNTQVAGVDEADFVKNDAQYVYVLSADGLHVIDAWPAKDTHEVTRLALPGLGTRLFLYDSRLVVFVRPGMNGGVPSAAQQCTYAYDCKFGAEPGRTTAIVYDVSNPSAPAELTRYELSGGYVASRRVGSSVYTVVYDRPDAPQPPIALELASSDPAAFDDSYDALSSQLEVAVDALDDATFLPWVQQARNGNASAKINACDEALVAEAASGASFTSLVTFDLSTLGAPHRSMIASKPGFIYASGSALYMASEGADGSDGYYYNGQAANEVGAIHKFALEQDGTSYVGSATVRGHLLNQFAMDEEADVLRVATTSGKVPDPNVASNLTTFSEVSGTFAKLGELTGLAPTEDIRSVRFDGTRGFVVTFKKTDPLYVLDLSTPARPAVLGELKIPGFSTYMHPLDHDHLLALGFEADDQGSFAYFNGIQIQIFDIAQLSDPKLLHKTVIGTRGSASDALTNHLAFNYFAAKALLALPMTICDGGGQGQFGDKLSFSGLMLFDVSLTKGVTERGRMPFVDQAESASVPSCSSWWTSTQSVVKRSIIMDDFAVGISDTLYKVADIADLSKPLASLSLSATR
jgi:hypothetical protein